VGFENVHRPVTLTASIDGVVQSIHLTPDEARTLGRLLARAAIAARREKRGRPPDT
jgi:Ser/Thr protein kinase RdoA (MazF antagonist)